MKRRSVLFLLFAILLIGADLFLIYKIITGETARSGTTTTPFTTSQFTTRESTDSNGNPPGTTPSSTTTETRTTTDAPRTASTTNTAIFSTGPTVSSITDAPTSVTSANNTSSWNVTTVTSQTAGSTVETNTTTSSYTMITMTATKESTSKSVPTDTTVTEDTTKIITIIPPWTKKSTAETSASTSQAPKITSEKSTSEMKTTNVVTKSTTKATSDMDATTHATLPPCNEFNYVARDPNTGVACIQANMTIQINLQYTTNDSRANEATLTVPKEAKTNGVCDDKIAEMTLSWRSAIENQADDDIKENKITFRYVLDDNEYFLDFISIDVYLNDDNFPNMQRKRIKGDTTGKHLRLFSTSMKHGIFVPQLGAKISVGDQANVLISDMSLIAFTTCSGTSSSTGGDYTAEASVNKGTIIGGVIGAIVLILVVFFLIWRKRKKNPNARPEHHLP